jgi:hypothetical protein
MSNEELQEEYRKYLLGFLTNDFEMMIDVEVLSFEEFKNQKENDII